MPSFYMACHVILYVVLYATTSMLYIAMLYAVMLIVIMLYIDTEQLSATIL